jgi:hypothetical protein
MLNNLEYHDGTSNIDQGMPPPLTPLISPPMAPQIMTPMGPRSQPIFRPTPRPLYPDQSCVNPQYHGSSSQPAPWLYLLLLFFLVYLNLNVLMQV